MSLFSYLYFLTFTKENFGFYDQCIHTTTDNNHSFDYDLDTNVRQMESIQLGWQT